MMRQFDDHPAPRFVSGRFVIERAPIPRSMCDALLGFFLEFIERLFSADRSGTKRVLSDTFESRRSVPSSLDTTLRPDQRDFALIRL